ncbi:MAG: leucine-rich repeat domain-containing protein, partial [Planctomycetota bacterium]
MAKDKAYREAEKKIEQARLSGATELELLGMSLTSVPESVGQLTHLQRFRLLGNELTWLPE